MRKILVANDDGITSDGIARLAAVAKKFGEVWVVAPQRQYSANSHAANFWTPLEVWPVDFPVEGVHAYATSGTPSDCVCVAINAVMPGKPDLAFGNSITASVAANGLSGLSTALPRNLSSFSIRKPDTAGIKAAMPVVEA